MSTVDVQVTLKLRGRAKLPIEAAAPRMLRITRLMALAIKFESMVKRREVTDFADIARLGYVTRARLTQIMNLLLLAPTIQEEILQMERQPLENRAVSERNMRAVANFAEWNRQAIVWARLKTRAGRGMSHGATVEN